MDRIGPWGPKMCNHKLSQQIQHKTKYIQNRTPKLKHHIQKPTNPDTTPK